jgi:tyrosinase
MARTIAGTGLDEVAAVARQENVAEAGTSTAGLSRRRFLQVGAAGSLIGLAKKCNPPPKSEIDRIRQILMNSAARPRRKDISTLTDTSPDIVSFRDAVTAMKALPSSDCRNWDSQAKIHDSFCPHGNWYFLPWHRAYLHFFEEICRELSGNNNFALPYWNWTNYPSVPAPFWGTSSNPLFHSPRTATSTSVAMTSLVGPATMASIMGQSIFYLFGSGPVLPSNQRKFNAYGNLEAAPHNHIHGFVGGTMVTFLSPLDPIFWAHHNMVEHVWWEWNLTRGNPNPFHPFWRNKEFTEFCDRYGNPVTVSVKDTLDYPLFNYRFDDLGYGL